MTSPLLAALRDGIAARAQELADMAYRATDDQDEYERGREYAASLVRAIKALMARYEEETAP